ncbi:liprin-beta-2b isoform X4 [Denticeps clupeoides]|uniref:liprin-beta-2b isoform X4 n=1 Tax=Denticeps clupeoides TaxID=299321 RepID=UPI0010A54D3E|nr:liprin-beta-2-like isoform X4 [Denticeps clupeoides]
MASDASHMLEAALEQMDDIIAGSKAVVDFNKGLFELGSLQVLQLAEDLRLALELQACDEERESLRTQLPCSTVLILTEWLERGTINLQSSSNNETCQERLVRLEGDKESLVLQVSVLTDQVEAQGEKIRDLESSLEEHHHKLLSTEEMLQQELLSRTSLETQKLDLMDEVSYLKLKLVGVEEEQQNQINMDDKQNKAESVVNLISELQEQMCRFQQEISFRIQEKRALEGHGDGGSRDTLNRSPDVGLGSSDAEDCCRCRGGENVCRTCGLLQELNLLKKKVEELEGEKSQYERKLKATKGDIAELQQLLAAKDVEIECLQSQLQSRGAMTSDTTDRVEEVYKKKLKEKYQELQRLKMGMECLLAANDEKNRHIEELTALLSQYRNMKDMMALTQVPGDRLLLCGSSEEELSGSWRSRGLTHKATTDISRYEISSRGSSPLLIPSLQKELDSSFQMAVETSIPPRDRSFHNGQWQAERPRPRLLSSSLEDLQSGSLQKNCQIYSDRYKTLPGKLSRAQPDGERDKYLVALQLSPDESEDSDFNLNRCRSASAPALGRTEKAEDSVLPDLSPLSSGVDSGQQSPVSPENRKNQHGIKKLWGKIRRSQSGSLPADDPDAAGFRRGGARATAGPRFSHISDTGNGLRDGNPSFSKWSPLQVSSWLEDQGLGQYARQSQQWVSSGQTLLSAASHDIEKEMGIKHPLHRKKLQLALQSFSNKANEKSSELDHIWVTRWLDDIGLPQYKDQFSEARVDGRMLQYMTVDDLLFLKVTSQLHHLSIKGAIHVLHLNKFNPNCLKRRPGDENKTTPSEVMQWSNHRVMEWLRSVDLAEYAPNLRGSGVHGGLVILEPRFNSDTLAMLLNIPPQKTLLRRHLATNFDSLVGRQAQLAKRDFTESPSYTPLSTTAKVRPKKLGFSNFGHLRKKKPDDSTDYICPLEVSQAPVLVNGAQNRPYSGFRGLSPILDRDPGRREQALVTTGTITQIEALSEGINNLTDKEGQGAELSRSSNTKDRPILCIRETTL